MQYCVLDTERIKGDQIYLLSYQLYDEAYNLVEKVTFQNTEVDLTGRKAPNSKLRKLEGMTRKYESFECIYSSIAEVLKDALVIVFSTTDIATIKKVCRQSGITYEKHKVLDLQKILFDFSEDEKHKSNLKQYCNAHVR